MKKIIIFLFAVIISCGINANSINDYNIKKVEFLKRYTVTGNISGTANGCTFTFNVTISFEWDGIKGHAPSTIYSTTLNGLNINCGGSNTNPIHQIRGVNVTIISDNNYNTYFDCLTLETSNKCNTNEVNTLFSNGVKDILDLEIGN